jgi:hypothetical protein
MGQYDNIKRVFKETRWLLCELRTELRAATDCNALGVSENATNLLASLTSISTIKFGPVRLR